MKVLFAVYHHDWLRQSGGEQYLATARSEVTLLGITATGFIRADDEQYEACEEREVTLLVNHQNAFSTDCFKLVNTVTPLLINSYK